LISRQVHPKARAALDVASRRGALLCPEQLAMLTQHAMGGGLQSATTGATAAARARARLRAARHAAAQVERAAAQARATHRRGSRRGSRSEGTKGGGAPPPPLMRLATGGVAQPPPGLHQGLRRGSFTDQPTARAARNSVDRLLPDGQASRVFCFRHAPVPRGW